MSPKSGVKVTSTVSDLAGLLKRRLASKMPCVLFLGSRASALAREGAKLKDLLKQFDPSPIQSDAMQENERFSHAYTVLKKIGFAQSDLHAILEQAWENVQPSAADDSLGELIKLGYFDTVITTNVDNLLDVCLETAGLHEGTDYTLFIRGRDDVTTSLLKPLRRPACQVIKLFGDFHSYRYDVTERWVKLDSDDKMKEFLEQVLGRDTILVGLDSIWEDGFDRLLSSSGGTLWYINDEPPQEFSPYLSQALEKRRGKCIAGPDGNFDLFFRALHFQLVGNMPPHYEITQQLNRDVSRLHQEVAGLHEKMDQIIEMLSKMSSNQGNKP